MMFISCKKTEALKRTSREETVILHKKSTKEKKLHEKSQVTVLEIINVVAHSCPGKFFAFLFLLREQSV